MAGGGSSRGAVVYCEVGGDAAVGGHRSRFGVDKHLILEAQEAVGKLLYKVVLGSEGKLFGGL